MTNTSRLKAINGLSKKAQVQTQKALTPEERRQASLRLRQQNAKKPTKNTGETSAYLSGLWNGFTENIREKGLKNLVHGAGSMGLGIAKGIAELPGDIAGLVGGAASLAKNKIQGKSWGDSWNQATQTGSSIARGFDRYSGLDWAQGKINNAQRHNMREYMKTNDMDPNNLGWADKAGLAGVSLANGAGQAVGMMTGPGVWSKAVKAPLNIARAVRTPAGAMNMARTTLNAAMKAPGTAIAKGKNFLHLGKTVRQGIGWRMPAAAGWSAANAVTPYSENKEYYEFQKKLNNQPAPFTRRPNGSGYSNIGYTDEGDDLARYINM